MVLARPGDHPTCHPVATAGVARWSMQDRDGASVDDASHFDKTRESADPLMVDVALPS